MRRKSDEGGNLRDAIIETAAALIAEKGVDVLSVAEITRRLRVSGSAPYQHFPGRDVLLAATAAQAGRQLAASMKSAATTEVRRSAVEADAVEALAAAAAAYVTFVAQRRVGFEFIFADDLNDLHDMDLAEARGAVMDVLLPLASAVVKEPPAALRLVEQCIAAAHGLGALYITGATPLRLHASNAVAAEAAQITRTLAAAASARATGQETNHPPVRALA